MGKARYGAATYEINGWEVPSGMSWAEFCYMRESLGFPRPRPRKALYLEDEEKFWNITPAFKKKDNSEHKWKSGGEIVFGRSRRKRSEPVKDYLKPPALVEGKPNSRLTEKEVIEIHALLKQGMSQSAIGRKYDVANVTIHKIAKKATWKELTDKLDMEQNNEQKV